MNDNFELNLAEIKQELDLAHEMYEILIPKEFPLCEKFDVSGDYRQVYNIGGDFFDVIKLPQGITAFAIGDISGKGISAALMMANLKFSMHEELSNYNQNLEGLATYLNQMVYKSSPSSRYLTLFFGQYNPNNRTLTYVNAGHNYPLLFRRTPNIQTPIELSQGGTVIGLFPDAKYKQQSVKLQAGDFIVAYTDGITEAKNINEEEFGLEQLKKECFDIEGTSNSSEIVYGLFDSVDSFVDKAKQHDDMTILVLKAA